MDTTDQITTLKNDRDLARTVVTREYMDEYKALCADIKEKQARYEVLKKTYDTAMTMKTAHEKHRKSPGIPQVAVRIDDAAISMAEEEIEKSVRGKAGLKEQIKSMNIRKAEMDKRISEANKALKRIDNYNKAFTRKVRCMQERIDAKAALERIGKENMELLGEVDSNTNSEGYCGTATYKPVTGV